MWLLQVLPNLIEFDCQFIKIILIHLNLDQDQKNIIDKLANFVARNGSKFEEMTKEKQKGNPKFAFLFSGEFYNYYRWKVSFEIGKTLIGYI